MGAFIIAWLVGEGIMSVRSVRTQGGPPWPGQMLATTGAFALLAVLAEASPPARNIALTVAWGLNGAALLALWPLPAAASTGWWEHVKNTQVSQGTLMPGAGGCIQYTGSSGSSSSSSGSSSGTSGGSGTSSGTSGSSTPCPSGYIKTSQGCVQVQAASTVSPAPAYGSTLA